MNTDVGEGGFAHRLLYRHSHPIGDDGWELADGATSNPSPPTERRPSIDGTALHGESSHPTGMGFGFHEDHVIDGSWSGEWDLDRPGRHSIPGAPKGSVIPVRDHLRGMTPTRPSEGLFAGRSPSVGEIHAEDRIGVPVGDHAGEHHGDDRGTHAVILSAAAQRNPLRSVRRGFESVPMTSRRTWFSCPSP